jgi:hypothetical protein
MADKKKTTIMSLVVDNELHDRLKKAASIKNTNVSSLIRETVEKYALVDDGNTKLILTIPKEVVSNGGILESWLNQKFHAIMKYFKS